jgi:hypothetical protein
MGALTPTATLLICSLGTADFLLMMYVFAVVQKIIDLSKL